MKSASRLLKYAYKTKPRLVREWLIQTFRFVGAQVTFLPATTCDPRTPRVDIIPCTRRVFQDRLARSRLRERALLEVEIRKWLHGHSGRHVIFSGEMGRTLIPGCDTHALGT